MTVWHWVRHGPTHEKTFVGWRDVPADLSDTAALKRLNDHLPQRALLVSSDLGRAVQTADAVALSGRRRLPHDPDLRELHFGLWDGMHFEQVAKADPDLCRAYWETPGDVAPPEGESWNAAAARVGRSVDALNAAHPESHVIAVAHFGVILTQLQRAMDVTAAQIMAHKIANLSVTELEFTSGSWSVKRINHLP